MLVAMPPTVRPDLEGEVGVEAFAVCVAIEAIFCRSLKHLRALLE